MQLIKRKKQQLMQQQKELQRKSSQLSNYLHNTEAPMTILPDAEISSSSRRSCAKWRLAQQQLGASWLPWCTKLAKIATTSRRRLWMTNTTRSKDQGREDLALRTKKRQAERCSKPMLKIALWEVSLIP